MHELYRQLYAVDEKTEDFRLMKIKINRNGLNQEIQVPYLPKGNEHDDDVKVFVLRGQKEALRAIEKLLAIIDRLSSSGSSRTIKMFVDGDGWFRVKVVHPKLDANRLFKKEDTEFFESDVITIPTND